MYNDRARVREQLDKFYEAILSEARGDNVITDEERDIVNIAKSGIEDLEIKIMTAVDEGLNDEEIKKIEIEAIQDMVSYAYSAAKANNVITFEESRLIVIIDSFLETGIIKP